MKFFAIFGILLILALSAWVCLPFLSPFIWALVIYQVTRPLERRLLKRFSPGRTALLLLLIVTLTLIIPLTLIGGQLVYEATTLFNRLQENGALRFDQESLNALYMRVPLPETLRHYIEQFNVAGMLTTHAAEIGRKVLEISTSLITSAAMNAGIFAFNVAAFLFLYYFACRDGKVWYRRIVGAVPASFSFDSLLERLSTGSSGLFWGVAGTCLAQGTTGGILFALLGLPSPFLAGAIMTFSALIPVVGTAIVWGPFVLWFVINGDWIRAVVLLLAGTFVVGSMDNVTRPLLTKLGGSEMPVFTVTIGALGGLALFGLTGVVVGPLALETFSWLLDRLQTTGAAETAEETAD